MSIFTDAQLTTWAQTYEAELCAKHNLLAARTSLAIVAGRSEYQLPSEVTNIRSVTWQGKEVYAKGSASTRITGDNPLTTGTGAPIEYLFGGKGLRVLRFMPAPQTAITAYGGNLWSATADADYVIVEYYRTPDYTDPLMQLPVWCRRYILKDYICWKAFTSEGKQQDGRAAAYYTAKVAQHATYFGKVVGGLRAAIFRVLSAYPIERRGPGRVTLPTNFGYPSNW